MKAILKSCKATICCVSCMYTYLPLGRGMWKGFHGFNSSLHWKMCSSVDKLSVLILLVRCEEAMKHVTKQDSRWIVIHTSSNISITNVSQSTKLSFWYTEMVAHQHRWRHGSSCTHCQQWSLHYRKVELVSYVWLIKYCLPRTWELAHNAFWRRHQRHLKEALTTCPFCSWLIKFHFQYIVLYLYNTSRDAKGRNLLGMFMNCSFIFIVRSCSTWWSACCRKVLCHKMMDD